MGKHPNVILKCTIKAEGTTRKLLRDLLAANRVEVPDSDLPFVLDSKGNRIENAHGEHARESRDDDQLCIGRACYHTLAMEEDYDEGWQISGKEGDLIVFDLVTYGYGEEISWRDLRARIDELGTWAITHGLSCEISVSANYW